MSSTPVKDHHILQAIRLFRQTFREEPEVAVFAPGRANLIGEHTDYNEGFVLPFALPNKTIIVASRTSGPKCTLVSGEFLQERVEFVIDQNLSKGTPTWANYVKGTIFQYLKDLPAGAAFNAAIMTDVPLGGGLSSSASLEVATATLLEEMFSLKINPVEKALRCQKAEHTYAGVPCGIMDQFISALGKEGNLLLIDCRSNSHTLVPFGSGEDAPVILVTNSKVKHALTGSEYPDRVKQCKEAVAAIQKSFPKVKSLRDADHDMLEAVRSNLSAVAYKRARHVIDEDRRTLQTVESLKTKDYTTVGKLMNQSHDSLRDDYEVSCEEIDFLVKCARSHPSVYGSRITGGGFGGCTVTLVDRKAVKEVEDFIRENYWKQYHHHCDFIAAVPSAGATVVELSQYRRFERESNAGTDSTKYDAPPSAEEELPEVGYVHHLVPAAVIVGFLALGIYIFKKR